MKAWLPSPPPFSSQSHLLKSFCKRGSKTKSAPEWSLLNWGDHAPCCNPVCATWGLLFLGVLFLLPDFFSWTQAPEGERLSSDSSLLQEHLLNQKVRERRGENTLYNFPGLPAWSLPASLLRSSHGKKKPHYHHTTSIPALRSLPWFAWGIWLQTFVKVFSAPNTIFTTEKTKRNGGGGGRRTGKWANTPAGRWSIQGNLLQLQP